MPSDSQIAVKAQSEPSGGGTREDGIGVLLRCVEDQIAIGKYAKQMLTYLLEEAAQNEEAVSQLKSLRRLQSR